MSDNIEETILSALQNPDVWSKVDWTRVAMLGLYVEIMSLGQRLDQFAQFLGCPLPSAHQQDRNAMRLMMLRHAVAGTPFEPIFAAILNKSVPS